MLSSLLALPGVLVKDVTEFVPPGFRDQNRILEVPLHLRDGDVTPLGVLLAREEEVLVLDLDVAGLGWTGLVTQTISLLAFHNQGQSLKSFANTHFYVCASCL